MESKGLLLWSPQPATDLYPEPNKCNPHSSTPISFKDILTVSSHLCLGLSKWSPTFTKDMFMRKNKRDQEKCIQIVSITTLYPENMTHSAFFQLQGIKYIYFL
jgi:hypothetical protein